MIPYKTENKTRFVSHTSINVVLGFLTLCNRTRKKKGHTYWEEKHTVFIYSQRIYVENVRQQKGF